ncbi:MAG TPA: DinB family protein [Ferruginibacter sp.]|nr:DinB family protein [Ferruginibacter sp.]HMP21163.1 DinB family protein [Ferruginibacter sp.]
MSELTRIVKLFADLQHGDCWIGTNFKEALHAVTAEQAAAATINIANTIWQLVAHVTYWRTVVNIRLNGTTDLPPFQDFRLPEVQDDITWKQAIHDLETSYHVLRNTLLHFKEENLDKPSPRPEQTYYHLIMGCLQHDAYHLGQIVLLKKQAIT